MKKPSLPYLETRTKVLAGGGKATYWYFRRGRMTPIRLPDPSDTGFLAAYDEAAKGPKRTTSSKTTISALIDSYMASARWEKLAPRTQRDYRGVLDHIAAKAGGHDVSVITRPAVIEARDNNRSRVRFANYLVQIYSILCEHAIDKGWMGENPVTGTSYLTVPKEKRQEHEPWTDAAAAKWREQAGGMERLAFELGVGTTQRPDDLARIRWGDYDGLALTIRQQKTGVELVIPCTPELKAALDKAPRRALTVLSQPSGRPMNYGALSRMMLAERKRLGLEAHDLHAMRYRGIMELAWAGCTDAEIDAISGHVTEAMRRKYAGKARQIMRAREAAKKRARGGTNGG